MASGGVTIALSSACTVLGTIASSFFVAAALQVRGVGRFVVAGVYIPPATSQWYYGKYGEHVDRIAEAVATLGLQHAVAREATLVIGDMNAHMGRLSGGLPAASAVAALPAREGQYRVERFSEC